MLFLVKEESTSSLLRMNPDKRRQARTQGRYSFPMDKKVPAKVLSPPLRKVENISVQYEEKGQSFDFQEVEKPKLITEENEWKTLSGEGSQESRIYYNPKFLSGELSSEMFDRLDRSAHWEQKTLMTRDGPRPQPRLVAWYGPLEYQYSTVIMEPNLQWPEPVMEIKLQVESELEHMGCPTEFNSVLLNLYRDGKDSVAWHSDDELSMGVHPTIASVSVGVSRRFEMARKYDHQGERQFTPDPEFSINLENGSLFVMDGVMQRDWLHRVPKEYHDRGVRINLTFRTVQETKFNYHHYNGNAKAFDGAPSLIQGSSAAHRETQISPGTRTDRGSDNSQQVMRNAQTGPQPIEERCIWKTLVSRMGKDASRIYYHSTFYSAQDATSVFKFFHRIFKEVEPGQSRDSIFYGATPRKIVPTDSELPVPALKVKHKVEQKLLQLGIPASFNSLQVHLHRNGEDELQWHNDSDFSQHLEPTIASMSLGEDRRFEIVRKYNCQDGCKQKNPEAELYLTLEHGSLLIMTGEMQNEWLHRIPKEVEKSRAMINLTFRTVPRPQ